MRTTIDPYWIIPQLSVQQPMPDFTLAVYQGGEITLSELKGKNVLLIFPRGLAGEDHWCHVCNYQYAVPADLEKNENIREKNDLEILFVLPYSEGMVQIIFSSLSRFRTCE